MLQIIGTDTVVLQLDTLLGAAGSSGALHALGVDGAIGLEIMASSQGSRGCEGGMSSSRGMVSKLSMALPLPPVGVTVGRANNQERPHSYID